MKKQQVKTYHLQWPRLCCRWRTIAPPLRWLLASLKLCTFLQRGRQRERERQRVGKICVEGMVMNTFYACQVLEMPLDFKDIANLPSFVLLHMGYFSDKFTLFEYNICSNLCCWIWICIQGRGLKTKAVQGHMVFHPKLVQGSS